MLCCCDALDPLGPEQYANEIVEKDVKADDATAENSEVSAVATSEQIVSGRFLRVLMLWWNRLLCLTFFISQLRSQ